MSDKDKKITIGIETVANTSGAEKAVDAIDQIVDKGKELEEALEPVPGGGLDQIPVEAEKAEQAIEEVADSAKDAGRAIDNAGKGPGLKRLPAEAKAAEGSIDALEEEVMRLNRELNKLPVGSAQFVTMAGRVKDAQQNLALAEAEARKLAGTVGGRGNAGMAVLEFSRAFEDAQYGIRGVLNNLPGLIAMLGGGAGLAGVISIAAVAGTFLWEKFGSGAKNAKRDTGDILETFNQLIKVYRDFDDLRKGDREKAANDLAGDLEGRLKGGQTKFQISVEDADLEATREKAAALLELAEGKLDLSRIEASLVKASGDDAVKLAIDRENVLRTIYQTELQIADIPRKAALDKAEAKVTETAAAAEATGANADTLRQQYEVLSSTVESLFAEVQRLLALRLGFATDLQSTQDRIRELKEKLDSEFLYQYQRDNINKEIASASSSLPVKEKELTEANRLATDMLAQANIAEERLKELTGPLEEATKAQAEAAKAQSDAARALEGLRETQRVERQIEEGRKAYEDIRNLDQDENQTGQKTSKEVDQIVGSVESALGNVADQPPVRNMIEKIKALAADGIQAGEQNEIVSLFQQLISKSQTERGESARLMKQFFSIVEQSVEALTRYNSRADEYDRRLKTLEINARR